MKSFAMTAPWLLALMGCSTHHWAAVEINPLPPPAQESVRHTNRLIVEITSETPETQCVVYERHHPICFYNVRPALKAGLTRSLWPSFPEVVVGRLDSAQPGDYVLQVDVELDALPPDDHGPGWSAGARSRFRLLQDGKVLAEETTASRSRAHFAYGAPLGEGATEAVDATIEHVAKAVFVVPESHPEVREPLPKVASQSFTTSKRTPHASAENAKAELSYSPATLKKSSAQAKSENK